MMYLQSIASAFPKAAYSQPECWDLLESSEMTKHLRARSLKLIQKVLLGESGIAKRHFAIDPIGDVFSMNAEALNQAFERLAPALGAEALVKALELAKLTSNKLDALFVCTCTGYLCPGVSSHLAERLALRNDACLHDVVGLGCGAAVPTLRQASHFLTAHPEARVAVVAVEICSAAFYLDNDPGVLISLCLFGDGASASIWSNEESAWRGHAFQSVHLPEYREQIRFVNAEGKLRNQLDRSVPGLTGKVVANLFHHRPNRNESAPRIITHTGGRDVLEAIHGKLPHASLQESTSVLRDYGNMSSPSVLVALERYVESESCAENAWLCAFGAGFSCHACELERC